MTKILMLPCETCRRKWPEYHCDAKPLLLRRQPGARGWLLRRLQTWLLAIAADCGVEFDYYEGPCCYGPGYNSNEPALLRWWSFDSPYQQQLTGWLHRFEALKHRHD